MENGISYIKVMPESKTEIQAFVDRCVSQVEIREALPLLARLTAMSEMIEKLEAALKDQLLEESNLYPEKSFTINGVKFEKKQKTTYYYDHCSQYVELKAELKKLQDAIKTGLYVDRETGELVQPHSSVTEYIAVTLRK